MVPSLPLLSCESSVSVKENPDRKKKIRDNYLQHTNFLSLDSEESVVVGPVIPVYTLRMNREIKTLSLLTRIPCSFGSMTQLELAKWLR